MKAVLIMSLGLGMLATSYAQTRMDKTIPLEKGKTINLHFDYPELIRVSTYDGNDIKIAGRVSINGGENDDAFVLENTADGSAIKIKGYVKNIDELPQRVTVIRDGQKMIFKDKTELRRYQQENGRSFNQINFGAEIDIIIDIKVPKGVETHVVSTYGMVEVINFSGPLTAQSTYGGVDASVAEKGIGEISAETNYGEIYTNLDAPFGGDGTSTREFHTYVVARPGNGPKYQLESQYGNVYIRKSVN